MKRLLLLLAGLLLASLLFSCVPTRPPVAPGDAPHQSHSDARIKRAEPWPSRVR